MRFFWCFFLLFLPLQLHAETIQMLNWDAYLDPKVKQEWETSTGHHVEIIKFDSDEKRDALLLEAHQHNIDIAVVDEIVAERFGEEGRFVEIHEQNLPSIKLIGNFWRERCGKYAVPYFWGTLGIIYRSDKVSPPSSWKEIIQPSEELKGHIGMLNDYTDLLAPVLFMNGDPLNTDNLDILKRTFNALKDQADYVLTYDYPITFLESSPQADQLYMTVGYGGDQLAMNERVGKEGLWKYVVPEEGTVLWVDCLAIPSNSKHIDTALNFIEYLNQPKVAAENAERLHYATPNNSAMAELSETFRNNPEVFPSQAIQNKSELYKKLSNENIKQRLRITNAIVNIHESKQTR
ncbi:spermidine/putrescine ABC transporter substrate-binding protein [Neptuniibacter sp. QD72_48]|uniref:polyamine ABC transporter substrate-binding protein n=1 Tax=unclassified Neptuniibacter TaxID=2630693 RepID=UPI0039F4F4EB